MKIIKKIDFQDVIKFFDQEHPVKDEGNFSMNGYARNLIIHINQICENNWSLVELIPDEILNIWLPHHQGEGGSVVLIKEEGLITREAISKLEKLSDYQNTNELCWKKISYWNNKELSPIFLSTNQPNHIKYGPEVRLFHLDGLHRLLAWGLNGSKSNIQAFVADK